MKSLRLVGVGFCLGLAQARGPTPLHTPLVQVSSRQSRTPSYKIREIVVETEPEKNCADGYEQTAGNCVRIDTLPSRLQCPPGWQNGPKGGCIGYTAVLPDHTCDRGSSNYGECVIESTSPKILECPEGYSLDTKLNGCFTELLHSSVPICPPGARASGGACIVVGTEPARTICPSDFELMDGMCVKIKETPMLLNCPEGFSGAAGKKGGCMRRVVTAPHPKCPVGYQLAGGDCVSETHEAPWYVCTEGVISGHQCVIERVAASRVQCPSGSMMSPVSGMCERDDVTAPLAECTKGTMYNPHTNQCGNGMKVKQPNLACPPNFHFVGKSHCVSHVIEAPTKVCPEGFILASKETCTRKETVAADLQCPPDTYLTGKSCKRISVAPYSLYCDEGMELLGKDCVAMNQAEPLASCPPDYQRTPDGRCVARLVESPAVSCPPDTTPRREDDELVCLVTRQTPAQRTCPISQFSRGDLCVEVIRAPATSACPPGYFEDLRLGRCFKSEVLPQRVVCPSGFKLVGDRCLKQETTALIPICPPGYKLSNTDSEICIKETVVAPINTCAYGFEYDEGVCRATKIQYEFDEKPHQPKEVPEQPREQLKDLDAPQPPQTTTTTTTTTPEAIIELTVTRPVVQKGLVMRNEPVILSGPASEVARQQAILNAGGDLSQLDSNVNIEYVPAQGSALGSRGSFTNLIHRVRRLLAI